MKKIAYIFLAILSVATLENCEENYLPPALDYVTFEYDPLQLTVLKSTSVSIDVHVYSTQISGSDRTFNVIVSDDTTLDPTSYSVPATVTIPANSNDGFIAVMFSDSDDTLDEQGVLVLDLDLGTTDTFKGSSINLNVQKKCPLNDINDLVGSFSVTSDPNGYENPFTTTASGDSSLIVDGLAQTFIADFWGETVIEGGTFTMNVNFDTGAVSIPRQYIYTTVYDGDNYDYEISGSGTWGNCGDKPTLTLKYDIYYVGESDGLAKKYSNSLNVAYLGGTFTID